MNRYPRAADAAKTLLHSAARRMMTADPTTDGTVSRALDQSLDWTLDQRTRDPSTGRSFEPTFAENDGRALSFQVQPSGHGFSPADQREITDGTARSLIYSHFGAEPLRWYDGRTEGVRSRFGVSAGLGARYSLGLDNEGLREVAAHYEWGPSVWDVLPAQVMTLARTVLDHMPSLSPFATTVRTSRMSGGQQISFDIPTETSLDAFRPLMEALGMGNRHGGFMTLLAFVLGARFSLPANVATLTLLNSQQGPEMRLDVNIDALPDVPEQLLPLMRLPMTERPQNLAALDRWMTAMTPDGYYGPGSVTVLSVRVKPSMPARLALYLRPVSMDDAGNLRAADGNPAPTPPATSQSWGQQPHVH
ncbi:hypothetical protein [Celeribacter arenosi]|uniref:Uncharacterized protein n=1 Tax=Celeribacter arenosi TaxID=792649 RepID=A0ABP7KGI4_9RHOB